MKSLIAALGLAVAAVGLSAPASANDDVGAYLQYLADHGINTGWRNTPLGERRCRGSTRATCCGRGCRWIRSWPTQRLSSAMSGASPSRPSRRCAGTPWADRELVT